MELQFRQSLPAAFTNKQQGGCGVCLVAMDRSGSKPARAAKMGNQFSLFYQSTVLFIVPVATSLLYKPRCATKQGAIRTILEICSVSAQTISIEPR